MNAYSLTGSLAGLRRDHDRFLVEVSNAKDEAIKEDATILARSIRKTLSVSGGPKGIRPGKAKHAFGGTPSAPGQPPHKQSGQLQKSVKQGIVGAGRIVAVMRYTGLWLEEGINAQAQRAGKRGGKRYTLRIAKRPFMERSLAAVQDEMVTKAAKLVAGATP